MEVLKYGDNNEIIIRSKYMLKTIISLLDGNVTKARHNSIYPFGK